MPTPHVYLHPQWYVWHSNPSQKAFDHFQIGSLTEWNNWDIRHIWPKNTCVISRPTLSPPVLSTSWPLCQGLHRDSFVPHNEGHQMNALHKKTRQWLRKRKMWINKNEYGDFFFFLAKCHFWLFIDWIMICVACAWLSVEQKGSLSPLSFLLLPTHIRTRECRPKYWRPDGSSQNWHYVMQALDLDWELLRIKSWLWDTDNCDPHFRWDLEAQNYRELVAEIDQWNGSFHKCFQCSRFFS